MKDIFSFLFKQDVVEEVNQDDWKFGKIFFKRVSSPNRYEYDPEKFLEFVKQYKQLRRANKKFNNNVESVMPYRSVLKFYLSNHITKGTIEPLKLYVQKNGDVNKIQLPIVHNGLQSCLPAERILDDLGETYFIYRPLGFVLMPTSKKKDSFIFANDKERERAQTKFILRKKYKEMFTYLMSVGLEINAPISFAPGYTLLHKAAYYNISEIAKLLLKFKPLLLKNNNGETALDIARERGNKKILALLEEYQKKQQEE